MADPNTLGGVDKAYLLAAITPRHLRASKRTVPGRVHPLPMSGPVEGAITYVFYKTQTFINGPLCSNETHCSN